MPAIELAHFKNIKLTKLTTEVTEPEIDEAVHAFPSRTSRLPP